VTIAQRSKRSFQGAVDGFRPRRCSSSIPPYYAPSHAPIAALPEADEGTSRLTSISKASIWTCLAAAPLTCRSKRSVTYITSLVFADQMFAPAGRSTAPLRRLARVDGRAADGTALPQYPLADDLTWRVATRTAGEQFGLSYQEEFAGVHENGHPGPARSPARSPYAIEQPAHVEFDEMVYRPTVNRFLNAETSMRPFYFAPFGRDALKVSS